MSSRATRKSASSPTASRRSIRLPARSRSAGTPTGCATPSPSWRRCRILAFSTTSMNQATTNPLSSAHRDDKGFVVAWFIAVVEKAKILQRLQDGDGVAHPIGVPADRLLAGNLMDRLDAVGDEALFLVARELIGILPYPAVCSGLVTASCALRG